MLGYILILIVFFVVPCLRLERSIHYTVSICLLIAALVLANSWFIAAYLFLVLSGYFLCFYEQQFTLIEKALWSFAKKSMPKMNDLEKQALKAGEKSIESVFFEPLSGKFDEAREALKSAKAPLEPEAQKFLDKQVQCVLDMCDDFKVNHVDYDLPKEVWQYLKDEKFFGLMISKEYGGLGFNNQAHGQILSKLSSKSLTLASIVAVPNSLGPGELIAHYGTDHQKELYLKDLAEGKQIPCFGLTSTKAGSDAQSIEDYAIVVKYDEGGEEKIGLKLNFSKRYITLAPIATLVGLAVKVYDPDLLYFDKEDVGITVLLLPADTPGIKRGDRHYPSSLVFVNGPIEGRDVIVSMEHIIGGSEKAGCGWSMLVECLTCGRAISLPSAALGSAWAGVVESLFYSELRYQFSRPIASFDAVHERLFEAYMWTSSLDHMRLAAISLIDAGEKPGVLSGAVKYYATENARSIACHVVDVMAGKAVMMGPSNSVIGSYHGSPVGITVEGANILTRGLMVFGQGILRSHPYLGDIAFSIDENNSQTFSEKVWQLLVSSYINAITLFTSAWRVIFGQKKARLLAMSSRFRMLTDLLLAYYSGGLKRKGQLCGFMADLLSLQFCYISVEAREEHQDSKEATLSFIAYKFSKTEKELVDRLPCPLRYLYKVITFFSPFSNKYPVSEMYSSLEDLENRVLSGEHQLLSVLDKNHTNINRSLETYRIYIQEKDNLHQYLSMKQSQPYLSLEQISEKLQWSQKTFKQINTYLALLEDIVKVDSFKNLRKKQVSS